MATVVDVVWGAVEGDKRSRLLDALEGEDFVLRKRLSSGCDEIRPVVAMWTRDDDATAFGLLDELEEAACERRLVSVLIEKTTLPPGLSPHPVVDLVNWRGSRENAAFSDLVRTLRSMATRCKPRGVGGVVSQRMRRLVGGLTAAAVLGFLFAFAMNVLALQNNLCSIRFAQPRLSDACGYLGFGGKPAREERLAWESRSLGACDALRAHIERFPEGAFRSVAADMLDGRRTVEKDDWVEDQQELPLFVPISSPFPDIASAEQDARSRAEKQAELLCSGLAATDSYRLVASSLKPAAVSCEETRSGHYCSYDGKTICALDRLIKTRRDICGPVP